MQRAILLASLAAALGVADIGYWAFVVRDETVNSNSTNTNSGEVANFNLQPTNNKDYTGNFSATSATKTISGSFDHDSSGNIKMRVSDDNGETAETYLLDSEIVSCSNDGKCIALPAQPSGSIERTQHEFDEAAVKEFKQNAVYKGKQPCPAGTCDVWDVKSTRGEATLFIDSNGLLSKIVSKNDSGTFEVNVIYKNVEVVRPANVSQIPNIPVPTN